MRDSGTVTVGDVMEPFKVETMVPTNFSHTGGSFNQF